MPTVAAIQSGEAFTSAIVAAWRLREAGDAIGARAGFLSAAAGPSGPSERYEIGVGLLALGDATGALAQLSLATTAAPGFADAHNNCGVALKRLGRPEEAVAAFSRALHAAPGHRQALHNRSAALMALGRTDEAFDDCAALLAMGALNPEARARLDAANEALEARDGAPSQLADAGVQRVRANRLARIGRGFADIEARVRATFAAIPIVARSEAEIDVARRQYAEGLDGLAKDIDALAIKGEAGPLGLAWPAFLAYQGRDGRALQARWGGLLSAVVARAFPAARMSDPPKRGERLRVGIVSPFFRRHANWRLPMQGWVEGFDPERFELFGYHLSAERDDVTERAAARCSAFHAGERSLAQWRDTILADAPHVLLYPGLMLDRLSHLLAAQRLAPLQGNSWGHPVTSGMPTMDLFLSSGPMEADGSEAHYTERLVRLPGFGARLGASPHGNALSRRAALGLRPSACVFWTGQSLPKFRPRHDRVFAEIAARAGDCQFLFARLDEALGATEIFQERLAATFSAKGLRFEDHCVFRPALPGPEFRAEMALCDVTLDSLGWGGCNTTLDALELDLPVVTLAGEFMRGRHGLGILSMLGMESFASPDIGAYVARAVELARDGHARQATAGMLREAKPRLTADHGAEAALGSALAGLGR